MPQPRCKPFDENDALAAAVTVGSCSPCAKSKRGVVIFCRSGILSAGYNHQPEPMSCDGSERCREHCAKLCIHAEEDALQHVLCGKDGEIVSNWQGPIVPYLDDAPLQMLHVKVVDGKAVPSGNPSCWQCSRAILGFKKISRMWLLQERGLVSYEPSLFHSLSLANSGLPIHLKKDDP